MVTCLQQWWDIKRCFKKSSLFDIFVFMISMLKRPRIFEILVYTPHNDGDIVEGRDKNFEVPRTFEHRYRKNKISKMEFFLQHPLAYTKLQPH